MNPKQTAASLLLKTQIGKEISRNPRFRIILSAIIGFTFNLFYALYHCILGIINLSLWFIAMCAFYAILAIMRFSAVLCAYRAYPKVLVSTEYFVMKLSGILLIPLSFVLTMVIYISLSQNIAIKYDTIIMITIATYTFYKMTRTIISAIKQQGSPSPLLAVIRHISYAEAAASILTLQRSMLVSFGSMPKETRQLMDILTGAAVCLFILLLGISMTVKGTEKGERNMAKSKLIKANKEIAEKSIDIFEKIEGTVVSGYQKIEDAFIDHYLTKDGETIEEAKKRLKNRTKSFK